MYNRLYIDEKIDKAIRSLAFLKANLKDKPEWIEIANDDAPVKAETKYALAQLQIIDRHMQMIDDQRR